MPRKGDVDGNGVKDIADIQMFTDKLLGDATLRTGETYAGEYCDWSGNDDSAVDGRDIQGFLENYLTP